MHRRDFNRFLCGGALLTAAPWARARAADGDPQWLPESMVVYDSGKTTELPPDTRASRHVAGECTRLIQTATGVLRLIVTPDLIDGLKRGEYCLELTYASPVNMEMAKLPDVTVTFLRMLIPLSGSFANNVSTVFLASKDVYDSVPYRNNASITAMRSYVETIVDQNKKRTYYPPF